jgi:hypothetical protein
VDARILVQILDADKGGGSASVLTIRDQRSSATAERPKAVWARIERKEGRDFTRMYQSLATSSSFHGTSPRSSAAERCAAAARSAYVNRLPASHSRARTSPPI